MTAQAPNYGAFDRVDDYRPALFLVMAPQPDQQMPVGRQIELRQHRRAQLLVAQRRREMVAIDAKRQGRIDARTAPPSDGRLIRLAAAISKHAAVSGRSELHNRDIAPAAAGQPVTPQAVVDFGLCLDICVPAQVTLTAPPPGALPDPLIEAAMARQPQVSDQRPDCTITPIKDGMQVSASLPQTHNQTDRDTDITMELADDEIWVSTPETDRSGARMTARADFVAASGKPFPLDPGKLRVTLIGPDSAVEFTGCNSVAR